MEGAGSLQGAKVRVLLITVAFVGMLALCVMLWRYGGAGGLIGAAVGFAIRLWGRGLDWGERLGNGYVGALMGLPVGLLLGGFYALGLPALIDAMGPPAPQ
jgi:hypothetical protein